MPHSLTRELRALQLRVEETARSYGLDFFETIYEVLDWEEISEVAAYGGYPARYPHWRFGMEYIELSRSYAYGLSKIYEMVINNDPIYAYLLAANHFMDQKLVMAHVCGHGDFFKHNFMFAHTNRKMVDEMANHATRVRGYMERYGFDAVEGLLDRCLSFDNLIDYNVPHFRRREPPAHAGDEDEGGRREPQKLRAKQYMDEFINPRRALDAERIRLAEAQRRDERFPARPEKDVMLFLLEHAPLKNWERDVLGMLREEAYYFAPQGRTKVLNEGWASYWHSTLMTERLLDPSEVIDYADHHAGTVATQPGQLNPYKLGLELFRDIEERWNKGRHGPEWEAADAFDARKNWDTGAMKGRDKIFEVRRHYNDVTFIDTFLTPDFIRRHGLFTYEYDRRMGQYVISDRDFYAVKEKMLFMMTNFGQPWIEVADGNFLNRGELLLAHRYEGVPLKTDQARETLENVQFVWKRPVHLETYVDDEPVVMSFDGTDHTQQEAKTERA
ncbi:SpoVR family protein [soil metagenome]|jgi:stage V sporulation protein R|nr:SpoVR family protein [Gemmatimonadota bacterium]